MDEKQKKILNRLPLEQIMRLSGHHMTYETEKNYFYRCPMPGHTDSNPSFSIDKPSANGLQRFHCFGCGVSGIGALDLVAKMNSLDKDIDENKVITILAKMFNLTIDGDDKNSTYHRSIKTEPSIETIYDYMEMGPNELHALGCKVQQLMVTEGDRRTAVTNKDGDPIYRFSWNKDFYEDAEGRADFDPHTLEETFGIHAVKSLITEQRVGEDGKLCSYNVTSTPFYPIFEFRYYDEKGWWSRRYEPYSKPDKKGVNYRFTWWWQNGKSRYGELKYKVYGDKQLMDAMVTGVVQTDEHSDHPTITVLDKNTGKVTTKFKRLIICSGPRDAMNVYYHSNAHVAWTHSESVGILPATIQRMKEVADELFILYDIDKTGLKRMESLALQFLDLRVIYLPFDLMSLRSSRSGKPCKDAEEYFNYYPSKLVKSQDFQNRSINNHFETLIRKAKTMKFWDARHATTRDADGNKVQIHKYTMNIDNMAQFLSARGVKQYKDSCGESRFVIINENIVEVLSDAEIQKRAKKIMKEYINNHEWIYNPDLSNAISESKRLNLDSLNEIQEVELNFHAWGEEFDFIFFRNGALLVTPDKVELKPYSSIPFAVNQQAIIDADWAPTKEPWFEISENPMVKEHQKEYEDRIDNSQTADERQQNVSAWKDFRKLWSYKLTLLKPLEECPPVFQWLYNMGRVYWRIEESQGHLSEEQKQFHDAQFVNKAGAIGFLLSQFRTAKRQQMVTITDYSLMVAKKASGRNGKSTIGDQLLPLVRNVYHVQGKAFKSRAETIGQNFHDFKLTVNNLIDIDDLSSNIDAETFYNLTTQISVKNLYNNEILLSKDESPKIFMSYNKEFDLESPSTFGRIYPMFASDYYHEENIYGDTNRRTPETEFEEDIFKPKNEEELQQAREMLVYFLQFYLRENKSKGAGAIIYPPIDKHKKMEMLYSKLHYPHFVDWANLFFEKSHHYGRPVAINEMVISFLLWQGEKAITVRNIEHTRDNWRRDMMIYCQLHNILLNPDVVSSGDSDRKRNVVRTTAWCAARTATGEYNLEVPRQKLQGQDCWYFYLNSADAEVKVPATSQERLNCTDMDLKDY